MYVCMYVYAYIYKYNVIFESSFTGSVSRDLLLIMIHFLLFLCSIVVGLEFSFNQRFSAHESNCFICVVIVHTWGDIKRRTVFSVYA
jgi:hypothetical protein